MTRTTNNIAPEKPGWVIINFIPNSLKSNSFSPGLKVENNAGTAINTENMGIKNQVLFRKNLKRILEKEVNNRQNKYRLSNSRIFLIRSTVIRKSKKVIVFIRGSMDCKNPFPAA